MQDPNEDTEWNDILRHHGILPPKKEAEITEDQLGEMIEETVREKQAGVGKKRLDDMGLDELDELEDEEDERVMLEYRKKRIAEMKLMQERNQFGDLTEITGSEYVQQVNCAGDGVWVVLHLFKPGIPMCTLINQHLTKLAKKFPAVKFLRSISSSCIPNFPDKNLPAIFVYYENDLKGQLVGVTKLGGMELTQNELEWLLSEEGAIQTEIEENPWSKRTTRSHITKSHGNRRQEEESDDDD